MTLTRESISFILALVGFAGAVASMVASFCYFIAAKANSKPETRMARLIFAPIAIFVPHFWTEAGNVYRRRHLFSLLAFAFFALIFVISRSLIR